MLIIIDATNAVKNESMITPLTINETKYSNIALIIKVNNPNVSRFMGRVISKRIGLINTFIIPSNADAIMIEVAVSAVNPVTREDAT